MVLSARRKGLLLALGALAAFGAALGACVPKNPVQRLAQEAPVAFAIVVDDARGQTRLPPAAVVTPLTEQLAERNLRPVSTAEAALAESFARVRLTQARFAALAAQAPDVPYRLLGELRVEFLSLSSGRYRWVVHGNLTAGRKDGGEPISRAFEAPVVLNFPHEKEDEALLAAAPAIAERAGALLDDLLALPVAMPAAADVARPTAPLEPSGTSTPAAPRPAAAGGLSPGTGGSGLEPSSQAAPEVVPGVPSLPKLERPGGELPITDAKTAGGFRAQSGVPGDAIYFVMVDRFFNGDPKNDGKVDPKDPAAFHGGDLEGVLQKLDYLQALGIRTVWLSPVFQMRTEKFFEWGAFHGYWTYDLSKVEPRFGDEAALKRLSDALHRRGMRLVLDMVLNHVGPDAPLVKQKPEWFHRKGPIQDWNDPVQLETHDVHGLPDFDVSREDVYAHLRDGSLGWIDRVRPDGFRLDAVKHLPLSFWQRYAKDAKAKGGAGFLLLAEMLDGDARLVSHVQEGGRFDAMFDFPLHFAMVDVFCKNQSAAKLGAVLSQDRFYADPQSLVTLLDNHDLPRILTECGGDVRRVEQALAFQLSARGTPSFNYGTEVGLAGKHEPENRPSMRFDPSHRLHRAMARGLEQRRKHPVLERGVSRILSAEESFFAYARFTEGEAAVIAVNRGKKPRKLALPQALVQGLATDADTGKTVPLRGGLPVPAESVGVVLVSPRGGQGFGALTAQAERLARGEGGTRTVEFTYGGGVGKRAPLYVAGSGPELGDWKPEKALGTLDARSARRTELPVGSVLEYKLLVRDAQGKSTWEEGPNRVLFVEDGEAPLRVRLQWRNVARAGRPDGGA